MRSILNPSINTIWRNTLLLSFVALLLPTYLFITMNGQDIHGDISNAILLLYLVITAVVYLWAARHTAKISSKLSPAWWLLSASMLWLVLGHGIWFVNDTILARTEFPIIIGLFYLLFYPSFWLGIYLLPQPDQTKRQRFRQLLDSITVLLGAMLLMWTLWVSPNAHGNALNTTTFLIGFLSPVSSFTMISAFVVLIFRPKLEQPREPLLLLGIGCPLLIVADFNLAIQASSGHIESGTITGLLWSFVCVFASMAAVLQATSVAAIDEEQSSPKRFLKIFEIVRTILPPLMLTVVYAATILYYNKLTPSEFKLASWGVWALFALVSIRQLLVMTENINLSSALHAELKERQQAQSALQQVNEVLEQRVLERTQRLIKLNEQLRQNEHKLRYDAFHDKLTGLSNRAFFTDYLQHALHLTRNHPDYRFGILFLDFDSFKVINDSLGHLLGDEFLIALSQRLEDCIGSGDLVARLGGDEFVVLLTNVQDIQSIQMVADRIQYAMRQPFDIDGHRLFTSVSIGIVMGDPNYQTAKDILRDADIAMYKAKDQGKSRSVVFNSSMRVMAMERLMLETELREALMRKELFLNYQPIWDIREKRVAGFEALVRWHHPIRGIISPLQFIPIAEETGMIVALGEWVLEEACRQMKVWHAKFPQKNCFTISVNISANQLRQSNLPLMVEQTLRRVGFPASFLKLEITESAFLFDIESALESFNKLKSLGLQLQLDDFGTGYSSLGYLHRLPITTLKIDRTFISRISTDGQHIEIARAISTLAHNLSMSIIAEGVETEAQLSQVEQLECEQVQGFLISKPLDVDAVEQFILDKMQFRIPVFEEPVLA